MSQRQDCAPEPSPLAEAVHTLVAHLGLEEEALREAAACASDLHRALRDANLEAVARLRPRQEASAIRLEALDLARRQVLAQVREALQLADEGLTLRYIAACLPAHLAGPLLAVQERLQRQAEQVRGLNRRSALLAAHGLAFVRACLGSLYGQGTPARYSSAGQPVEARRVWLLEVRG